MYAYTHTYTHIHTYHAGSIVIFFLVIRCLFPTVLFATQVCTVESLENSYSINGFSFRAASVHVLFLHHFTSGGGSPLAMQTNISGLLFSIMYGGSGIILTIGGPKK